MLYRLIFVLGSILLFINSCNSVISSLTGTQKLRRFTMEQVEKEGISDSDYVEISNVQVPGEYLHVPPREGERKGVVQYPVMSQERYAQWQNGQPANVSVVVWTQGFDPNCVDRKDCITSGQRTITGIVNKIPTVKNKVKELNSKYQISEQVIYIETERAPLAWYWNLAVMAGAVIVVLATEYFYNRRKKIQSSKV